MEADGIRVVVLPALPFGPTPEHRGFGAGYIDLEPSLHDAVVEAILTSLADQGFARILVWRGCGGHDLQAAVTRFNRARRGAATAYLPGQPFHDIWCAVADPTSPVATPTASPRRSRGSGTPSSSVPIWCPTDRPQSRTGATPENVIDIR